MRGPGRWKTNLTYLSQRIPKRTVQVPLQVLEGRLAPVCGFAAPRCGKAPPYRGLPDLLRLCLRRIPERHSLEFIWKLCGKAKPYRTGGGKAAQLSIFNIIASQERLGVIFARNSNNSSEFDRRVVCPT
jgi:hypothetical protein